MKEFNLILMTLHVHVQFVPQVCDRASKCSWGISDSNRIFIKYFTVFKTFSLLSSQVRPPK